MNAITKQEQFESATGSARNRPSFAVQAAIAAGLLLCFMTVVTLSITLRYETIDDIVMHEYAAGLFFFFKPDDHMIYTHVLLGKVLSSLYNVALNVPWYPLYQLVCLFLSSLVICATFVKIYGGKNAVVPSLIYGFAVLAPAIICLQFTTTAAIAGIAGGVLLFSALESSVSTKWRWWLVSGGMLAVVFASFMRQKAGWMVLVLFAVYATVRYFGSSWKKLGISLAVAALLGLITQGLWMANNFYYKQTGWGEFETWRRKLHPLYDFYRLDLRSKAAADTIKAVGWSGNDVAMLNTCMHWDRKLFSIDNLDRLVNQGHAWVRSDLNSYLPSSWRRLVKSPEARIVLYLLLASLLLGCNKFLSIRRVLLLIGAVAAVALATTVTHKASMHVYLPMLYMLAVARLTALKLDGSNEIMGKRVPEIAYGLVVLVGCLGLFAFSLDEHNKKLASSKQVSEKRIKQLKAIAKAYPDKLTYTVVGAPTILPFEKIESLKDLKLVSSYSSWMVFGKQVLQAHGISDFGEGLLSDKVLVLSCDKQNNTLKTFFKEHYGKELTFRRHGDLSIGSLPSSGVYDVVVENRHAPETTD